LSRVRDSIPTRRSSDLWLAENTNQESFAGSLKEAVVGADVFIGVSAPDLLDEEDIKAMNTNAIVFAMSNPDPEVHPEIAARHAADRKSTRLNSSHVSIS